MARGALTKVAGSYAPEVEEALRSKGKVFAGLLAWGRVVEAQAEVALDPAAFGTTQAARFVGQAAGFIPSYASQVAPAAGDGVPSGPALGGLEELLAAWRAACAADPALAERARRLLDEEGR